MANGLLDSSINKTFPAAMQILSSGYTACLGTKNRRKYFGVNHRDPTQSYTAIIVQLIPNLRFTVPNIVCQTQMWMLSSSTGGSGGLAAPFGALNLLKLFTCDWRMLSAILLSCNFLSSFLSASSCLWPPTPQPGISSPRRVVLSPQKNQ